MSEEEYYSGNEDVSDDYVFSNIQLLHTSDSKIKRKNYTTYYYKNGREFIHDIRPWTFNYPVNEEHIKSICEQVKRQPQLTGVFSIIQLNDYKLILLDGHHRHQALLKLYEDEEFDEEIEIEVHCYQSDTIDSNRTSSLFQKLNNIKPFKVKDEITYHVIKIIQFLEKKYPGVIKSGKTRANFPYIHKETLNDKLHQKFMDLDTIDESRIQKQIQITNREYEKIANILVTKQKKDWSKIEPRLQKTGCYLGLRSIDEWICNFN